LTVGILNVDIEMVSTSIVLSIFSDTSASTYKAELKQKKLERRQQQSLLTSLFNGDSSQWVEIIF
jgi:hypothetical protein